jgi:hypothetical protein
MPAGTLFGLSKIPNFGDARGADEFSLRARLIASGQFPLSEILEFAAPTTRRTMFRRFNAFRVSALKQTLQNKAKIRLTHLREFK